MFKMDLWEDKIPYNTDTLNFVPTITPYLADSDGCIVVFAGGAYGHKAPHEGPEMCKWLQSIGITCFNVDYRIAPYRHPAEISDAIRAVRFVRYYSDKFNINPNKIAVMGFSAGGHLAGSVSVHYNKDMYSVSDEIDKESARPDASILCYPVIDMFEYRHDGSRVNLIGNRPLHSDKELMSLYMHVDENTPQSFLWHTSDDQTVPVENTLLYASALSKANVPFEIHIYPHGHHGLGIAQDEPHVAQWTTSLDNWLKLIEWK